MPAMPKPGNEFEPCRKAIARNKMKCAETRRGATIHGHTYNYNDQPAEPGTHF